MRKERKSTNFNLQWLVSKNERGLRLLCVQAQTWSRLLTLDLWIYLEVINTIFLLSVESKLCLTSVNIRVIRGWPQECVFSTLVSLDGRSTNKTPGVQLWFRWLRKHSVNNCYGQIWQYYLRSYECRTTFSTKLVGKRDISALTWKMLFLYRS